jgi:glycosyltransferase involved in cell wall biosynthesis
MNRALRILQVSTSDTKGGAERVAWSLAEAYRAQGHQAWLAVGDKYSYAPDVFPLPNDDCRSRWAQSWAAAGKLFSPLEGKVRGAWRLRQWLPLLGQSGRLRHILHGYEDFDFPGTWSLLQLPPARPEIMHAHNLHGNYFDLRALPWLSRQLPLILTLHDAWLLSGHCAHSFGCERWKTGCGACPDLTIPPAILRDQTAANWQRKREIYARSLLYVATPSRWLMEKVEQSMLLPGVAEARVVPNGVDLSIFRPGDKHKARAALGLPAGAKILLFAANGIRKNVWKDYQTMRQALALVSRQSTGQPILLVALGENAPPEQIGGGAELRFIPYQQNPQAVAQFYQAADLYLHAARADTFPNTVLEALACGTPVVATAVGGIPEQVKSLSAAAPQATGILTPVGEAEAMAAAILTLLTDDALRQRLGDNAAQDARERFDLNHQVTTYLAWYREIIKSWLVKFGGKNRD